jgi:hypothetical protein
MIGIYNGTESIIEIMLPLFRPAVTPAIMTFITASKNPVNRISIINVYIYCISMLKNNAATGTAKQSGTAKQMNCDIIFANTKLFKLFTFKNNCCNMPLSISRSKIKWLERLLLSIKQTMIIDAAIWSEILPFAAKENAKAIIMKKIKMLKTSNILW